MQINFKQPKYVLPLLCLPFLLLFFYAWQKTFIKPVPEAKQEAELKGTVGNVSLNVRKKELTDKLDAYRNTYKESEGYSAVNMIPKESSSNAAFKDGYTDKEKTTLDSISLALKTKYNPHPSPSQDGGMASTLNAIYTHQKQVTSRPYPKEKDPMDVFKQQLAYIDSVSKVNDPANKAEKLKKQSAEKAAQLRSSERTLAVTKSASPSAEFNTVRPPDDNQFISAVIDENVIGYAGSRLRLKLLEDIIVGGNLIKKGTFLFAQISGFSQQRVALNVSNILSEDKLYSVKLDIYDLDGLPGLYVPSSSFREFTRDFGGSSVQGITIDDNATGGKFIMSSMDKLFQSTSSAIAGIIRKNKAMIKYNSYIYLMNTATLHSASVSF